MPLKLHRIISIVASIELVVFVSLSYYVFIDQGFMPKTRQQTILLASSPPLSPTAFPTPALTPTLAVIPTTIPTPKGNLTNYQNHDYGYQISYPRTWDAVMDSHPDMAEQTYTIYSPDNKENVEILIREGLWADVKRQLPATKNTKIAGQPAIYSKDSTGKGTYTISSIITGQIIQISVTGQSSEVDKIISSFKFLQ